MTDTKPKPLMDPLLQFFLGMLALVASFVMAIIHPGLGKVLGPLLMAFGAGLLIADSGKRLADD